MKPRKQLSIIHYQLLILLFISSSFVLQSQTINHDTLWLSDAWYFKAVDSSLVDLNILFPSLLKDQIYLKRYIRDDQFLQLRKSNSDMKAIDAIFDQSMILANDDIAYALFIALWSVMDHHFLTIRVPLIGNISFPLTTETKAMFDRRHRNLPSKVMSDSLSRTQQDKDKLQHFFGSAFLAYSINSKAIPDWIGDLIEKGEASFVVGGEDDLRDRAANRLGQEFGLRLLKGEEILPSDVLSK